MAKLAKIVKLNGLGVSSTSKRLRLVNFSVQNVVRTKIPMSNEDHYRKLENMYHQIWMSINWLTELSITKGEAIITMEVQQQFMHAAKAMHGTYYFKLLDDAGFFAANSLVPDHFVLTSQFNIYLLKPVFMGEKVVTKAKVVNQTRSQFISECYLYNEDSELIGHGTGMYVKSKMLLTEIENYSLIS